MTKWKSEPPVNDSSGKNIPLSTGEIPKSTVSCQLTYGSSNSEILQHEISCWNCSHQYIETIQNILLDQVYLCHPAFFRAKYRLLHRHERLNWFISFFPLSCLTPPLYGCHSAAQAVIEGTISNFSW